MSDRALMTAAGFLAFFTVVIFVAIGASIAILTAH
jgi:hypothetical protein